MNQLEKPSEETTLVVAPAPTASFSLAQYYREKLENVRQNLPEAARQLKVTGVARVQIQYDGCDDSGQIESVMYIDREGKLIDPAGQGTFTEEQLKDLFYDLIQARHAGWENNDGAFGEFEWDLAADTLNHTHHDRFTEYDTTEHEGL